MPSAVLLPPPALQHKTNEQVHTPVRQNKHSAKSLQVVLTQCKASHTWLHAISSQFQLTDNCCDGSIGEANGGTCITGCACDTARETAVVCKLRFKGAAETLG